jgi:plasmid stabilization system protein ParE
MDPIPLRAVRPAVARTTIGVKAQRRWQVILGIYDRVQVLRQFPELGQRYDKYPEKHIRILLYGHYRIAYLTRDERTIHILGILHGSLDIDEHLKRIL